MDLLCFFCLLCLCARLFISPWQAKGTKSISFLRLSQMSVSKREEIIEVAIFIMFPNPLCNMLSDWSKTTSLQGRQQSIDASWRSGTLNLAVYQGCVRNKEDLVPLACEDAVYMCLVVTCWERADLLALVCGVKL